MTDPRPTTNRGRRAGGRELRAWASADEFETVTRAAEAAGVTREQFIRDAALGVAKAVAAALEARAKEIDAKADTQNAYAEWPDDAVRVATLRRAASIVRGGR
jgi:uncharacterized protein (DUF1778 family)